MPPTDQVPDELNDAELQFEDSLRTLRPSPARLDVAAAIAAAGSRRATRRRTHLRQISAAAAVFVAVGVWWASSHPPGANDIATHGPRTSPLAVSPASMSHDAAPPTLMAYRRAFAHSPVELDRLLDRQSTSATAQVPSTPVDVLSLRHAEFLSSNGAM